MRHWFSGVSDTQAHVVELDDNSGFPTLNGHLPDYNVNLHDHNPRQDGIPRC